MTARRWKLVAPVEDRQGGDPDPLRDVIHRETWLSHGLPPEATCGFCAGVADKVRTALAAATPALSEDRLRTALDDAMVVAAILRSDPSTALLANRLDVSLHKALALSGNVSTAEPHEMATARIHDFVFDGVGADNVSQRQAALRAAADSRPAELDVERLAESLHDAMCDVSHHDRPPARCLNWPRYPSIARSVVPRYARLASTEADQSETPR